VNKNHGLGGLVGAGITVARRYPAQAAGLRAMFCEWRRGHWCAEQALGPFEQLLRRHGMKRLIQMAAFAFVLGGPAYSASVSPPTSQRLGVSRTMLARRGSLVHRIGLHHRPVDLACIGVAGRYESAVGHGNHGKDDRATRCFSCMRTRTHRQSVRSSALGSMWNEPRGRNVQDGALHPRPIVCPRGVGTRRSRQKANTLNESPRGWDRRATDLGNLNFTEEGMMNRSATPSGSVTVRRRVAYAGSSGGPVTALLAINGTLFVRGRDASEQTVCSTWGRNGRSR